MKIREGFVIREIGGEILGVATGGAAEDFHGMLVLNETAREIWNGLEAGKSEADILELIVERYDVEEETARKDMKHMIEKMKEAVILIP